MSLCLKYIDVINNVIREDSLEFIPVHSDGARVCEALGKINVGSYNLY
jgi:threonine aldolase